ncbi:hypothetical protein RND81_14G072800 [Saponaria officinalis]|uniref:Ribosomal protein L34e superfamily protein n=1 Tax=Saponaria officinalis TaxID=3572 RepID=A0AAW1GLS7_SAPOF
MRHHPLSFSLLPPPPPPPTMPSSSAATTTTKPRKPTQSSSLHHHNHHNHSSSPLFCRHHHPSATATLDLLILILVLISGTFLLTSYFSYLFNSLSLLLPSLPPPAFLAGAALSLLAVPTVFCLSGVGVFRRRRCGNPNCKGLTKALEFDLQLQSEETLKPNNNCNSSNNGGGVVANDIEKLPWKGGSESNPDYECLRAELRKMAPPNGRAVLLFRAKCGCPVAKLVGWGPKKGRKHKKALANTANNGDHR